MVCAPRKRICSACPSHDRCRDHGLTVAQAAIAGTDLDVLEDLKAFGFEAGAEQAGQPAVVQTAARKRNLPDTRGRASQLCGADKSKSYAGMEARCDARLGDAGAEVCEQLTPQWGDRDARGLVQIPVASEEFNRVAGIERVGLGSVRPGQWLAGGEPFEFDCRLRLVIDLAPAEYYSPQRHRRDGHNSK